MVLHDKDDFFRARETKDDPVMLAKTLLLDHPYCHDIPKQNKGFLLLRILDSQQLWRDLFMYIVFLC